MEGSISLAKRTFFIHLKDIINLYCPHISEDFNNFEKGFFKTKNMLQTHQTLQFYFNQIKKGTSDQRMKSIINCWKNKLKETFVEDKNLLYLVLMYLFYQIETSIDFLIEGGKLASKEKESKQKELKDQCMQKLSLKAEIKLTHEEYNEVISLPEINKEDFKENKTMKTDTIMNDNMETETKEDNLKDTKQTNTGKSHSEEETMETNDNNCKNQINTNGNNNNQLSNNPINSLSSNSLSLEEKLILMEEKISRLGKVEEELTLLRKEVNELKTSSINLQLKCEQYETKKIIKSFIKHFCFLFDIPYSSYRIAMISTLLKNHEHFKKFSEEKHINLTDIDNIINIYYELEMSLMINDTSVDQMSDFITKNSQMFTQFNFSPTKSQLFNHSSIQNLKKKLFP